MVLTHLFIFRFEPITSFCKGIIFFIIFIPFNAISQKVVSEHGEYKMPIEKSMSEQEAERVCIERARINAIENAFGQTIIQGNSTYIKNERTGASAESKVVFNMMAETMVNGEWVEDIKPPEISKIYVEGVTYMIVEVFGKIREIKETPITFKSALLACPKTECKTTSFNNKQSVYLEFTAPEDGYISVYCDVPEEKTTFRMLPYKTDQNVSSYPVKADETYLFFHPQLAKNIPLGKVDEFVFYLNKPNTPEVSKVFVLFRPKTEIAKPILSGIGNVSMSNIEIPLNLPSEDFQRWLQRIRRAEADIQLETTVININP